MTPEPTQDEFDAWLLHPVSQYVAEAYRIAADKQRAAWERYFDASIVPADISALRLELKTREDAYRSILENTLADYIAIVDGSQGGSRGRRPASASAARSG